jgi:hypothetical protein
MKSYGSVKYFTVSMLQQDNAHGSWVHGHVLKLALPHSKSRMPQLNLDIIQHSQEMKSAVGGGKGLGDTRESNQDEKGGGRRAEIRVPPSYAASSPPRRCSGASCSPPSPLLSTSPPPVVVSWGRGGCRLEGMCKGYCQSHGLYGPSVEAHGLMSSP